MTTRGRRVVHSLWRVREVVENPTVWRSRGQPAAAAVVVEVLVEEELVEEEVPEALEEELSDLAAGSLAEELPPRLSVR